jgi:NAD(P)-dependent dehydrogenase (short-subunit alcohol dehydrogenase family)
VSADLRDRVVIVTGASRGIGKGLALGLAGLGAKVVCAARTVEPAGSELPGTINETVDAIRAAGRTATAIRCDIGEAADITNLIDATVAEYGRIDSIVNNAMTPTRATFEEATVDEWDASMRVNVRSLFLITKAVVPVMQRTGGGSIINISSGGAEHASQPFMPPGYLIYVVAKAALERYTSATAPELREFGVTMNSLRPGAVKTEHTTKELGADNDWSGWATPESVVPAVAFLAAQIDTDFTGRVLDVSGYGTLWPSQ